MKLRASFFNPAAFRKNLTRFAPCWGLYSLFWLISVFLTAVDSTANVFVQNMVDYIPAVIAVNGFYAFLVAQLLFGDLYNSRLCSGLHCLPLRRECWFVTNLVSGLVFVLIPMGLTSLVMAIFAWGSTITGAALVAPMFLLAAVLSFLCFFGLGVLASFCVGNRFASLVVYGLMNFGAQLVYGILELFYVPDYYGVVLQFDPFLKFCPLMQLVEVEYLSASVKYASGVIVSGTVLMQSGWNWLCIYAGVGAGALVVALLLYRHRHLEKAGDFIAVRGLESVFLLVYTLCVTLLFGLFWQISEMKFFVYLGVAVGYFTGRMFLKRTTRVFQWKAIASCFVGMLMLAASFGLNRMDPFGIERRIPDEEDIQCVYVTEYPAVWLSRNRENVELEDEQDIAAVRQLHKLALEDRVSWDGFGMEQQTSFSIGYKLKNGAYLVREYNCYVDSEAGDILRSFFSSTEQVLGLSREQTQKGSLYFSREIYIYGTSVTLSAQQLNELVSAIAADCAEGNMVDNAAFHDVSFAGYIELRVKNDMLANQGYVYLEIYEDCTHTLAFLEENDLMEYMQDPWEMDKSEYATYAIESQVN